MRTIFETPRMPRRLAAFVMLALPLAACARVDHTIPTASIADDYHARHPVSLQNSMEKLDIFLVGTDGKLDARQTQDLRMFALAYKSKGQGRVTAMMPSGSGQDAVALATLEAARRIFAQMKVPGAISVGSYPVVDPRLAAPIQFSYASVQAQVHNCGDWPDDLASGSSSKTFDNTSYYNLGCASQKTLSAQIDDPRDLVRPRAEDPSDVSMRTRAIGNIRAGTDPGTAWNTHNSSIGSVGN
jgi:pilus assembly protein CpaD